MASSHSLGDKKSHRRELLQGLAGTGFLLAAGCLGEDPAGDGGGSEQGSALTFCDIFNPQDLQYNWLNPSESGAMEWTPGEILYDRFLLHTPPTDEYHTTGFIFENWDLAEDVLTVEISQEHHWHDGDQVTADDVEAHWKLEVYSYESAGNDHPYLSSVEAVDDFTVEFTLHEEYNEDLLLQALFTNEGDRLYTKRSLFDEELEQLESADSQNEMESIFSDAQQKTIDEPVGNGPFEVVDANEQALELELFEQYPTADGIEFDRIQWRAYSDGQAELQAIQAGDIDVTLAISPQEESIMEQWPAGLETPRIDMPQFGGRALSVQLDHEVLGIPEVRRAIAHVVSRDNIATNTPENLVPLEYPPSGVPESVSEIWLGDLLDSLEPYEQDEERAAELMREAGFERSNEEWVDDDGEQISLEIKTHPYADSFIPIAQTASDNLTEFGIETEMRTLEQAVAESDAAEGNYELMVGDWGGGAHPYIGYLDLFVSDYADAANVPEEFEVSAVGEPDGDTVTINTYELVNEMPTQDQEEAEESVHQLAWVVNQQLPVIPLTNMFNTGWLFHPDEWEYTTDDEGLMSTHNPAMFGPRMNFLQPVDDS